VRGTLHDAAPKNGTRVTCYCRDCQAYEAFLGRTDDVLNDKGGSDIYQTVPHRFTLETGHEHLAAIRVTDGRLLRWYTRCCQSPLGSTPDTPDLPIMGLLTKPFLQQDADAAEKAFGKSKGALFPKEAWSPPLEDNASLPALIVAALARAFGTRLKAKGKEHPFFTADKTPRVEPRLLSPEERAEIDARLDARRA
jgi:hypothetical protein